jgi:diguanylate cyclase (GGDEF)-like protein
VGSTESVDAVDRAPRATPSAPRLRQALLPYILVPAVLVLVVYTWQNNDDTRLDTGIYIGGVILVGLVLLRQLVAMREMIALYANNEALNRANGRLATVNTQLEVLATTDPLTGLANRTLLRERVELALAGTSRLALLLMDLDRFKEINDTLGHQAGDQLLQQIALRLRDVVRDGDTVARLGGDEFAVLLPTANSDAAIRVARGLLSALTEPCDLGGYRVDIGASVGIALYPDHGSDPTTLLREADVAMYTAKRARTGHAVYAAAQDHYTPVRLALMSELREALAADALILHYQPQVSLIGASAGHLLQVEALLRWPHPEHGMIPPDEFIPLAEHTGLIGALTAWVLGRALGQVAAWEASGLATGVAVNLSAHTLHEPDVYDLVADALHRHGVAPARLTLEVTESALMLDPDRARAVLVRLRDLGVRISIDDFGTGYSSLGYLKDLPVDEVKIDKGFVLGMGVGGDTGPLKNAALVQSIVAMAHALGLGVVAEGVETASVARRLASLHCDIAQGYYLSRPLPAAELAHWAQAQASMIAAQALAV